VSSETTFLAKRMLARQQHRHPRCWGISSDALALYGVGGGPRPQTPGWAASLSGRSWSGSECGDNYPHDEGDLLACELTYEMAPPRAQIRMLPVLKEFRRWVTQGINRYGAEHPYQKQAATNDGEDEQATIGKVTP